MRLRSHCQLLKNIARLIEFFPFTFDPHVYHKKIIGRSFQNQISKPKSQNQNLFEWYPTFFPFIYRT